MKSKKLFAILTLVAFMMTLLPMAAFGAVNKINSTIAISPTTVKADDSTQTTITMTFPSAYTSADGTLYIWAERNGVIANEEQILTAGAAATNAAGAAQAGTFTAQSNSVMEYAPAAADSVAKIVLKMKSAFAGTTTIKAGLAAADIGAEIPTVANMTTNGKFVQNATVTFTAGTFSKTNSYVTQDTTSTYQVGSSSIAGYVYVLDSNGYLMKDVVVTATSDRSEDTVTFDNDGKTDNTGKVKTYFKSTKQGSSNVTYYANGAEVSNKWAITVTGDTASSVAYVSDGEGIIGKTNNMDIVFKVLDKNSNPTSVTYAASESTATAGSIKIKVDGPAGTTFDDSSWYLDTPDVDDASYLKWTMTGMFAYYEKANGKLHVGYDKVTSTSSYWSIADEGKYTVTVSIQGEDVSAKTSFEVKEQGTITSATMTYKQSSLNWGAVSEAPTVKYVDAAGVKLTAANTAFIFSVSDPRLATVDNGAGANQGKVTAKAETAASLTGKLTVTATDSVKKVFATADIQINGDPSTIAYTAEKGVVGNLATVSLQVKDSKGTNVAFGDLTTAAMTLVSVEQPAGAIVTLEKGTDWDKAMERTGAPTFKVRSDKAGTVKVNVILQGDTDYVAVQVPVVFGDVVPAIGAKSITMFIGSKGFTKDGTPAALLVAPFISTEGRTMVGVRDVAGAFGVADADISFVNGVVTLKRADVTVTITIGSKDIKAGDKTITSDVAAYVTADNRTVLPIKFIGDAFGYTATFDAATQSVVFAQ